MQELAMGSFCRFLVGSFVWRDCGLVVIGDRTMDQEYNSLRLYRDLS